MTVRARLGLAQDIRAFSKAEFYQIKQQIVTVLSHELRTPLTYVTGYTGMALGSLAPLSPNELKGFLVWIKSGADRLTKLVAEQDFPVLPVSTF